MKPQLILTIAKSYLGYNDFGKLHKFLAARICEPRKHQVRMILIPRGFFKTSFLTISYSVAQAIIDPNIRILMCSENYSNASAWVSTIGRLFTENENFRIKYPDYCPKNPGNPDTKWTNDCIILPNRTKYYGEGTFEAMGLDSTIVSRHYSYMKFDDLVSDKNITNKEQLDKVIKFFEESKGLCDIRHKTPIDVVGTTWDDSDLYDYLSRKKNVEIIKVPAQYNKERTTGIKLPFKKGESIFPERVSTEDLTEIEKDDPDTFAKFYALDPVPRSTKVFKNFEYYAHLPGKLEDYRKFMTVDPAHTDNPTANYSAIVICAVSEDKRYVLLTWRDRVTPGKFVDKMEELYYKYNCEKIGIETDVYQIALKYWLYERMIKADKYMKIIELKARGKAKDDRISALEPYVNTGQIIFARDQQDLVYELDRFPKARTKDLADCLAYQLEISKYKSAPGKEKRKESRNSLFAWKRRMKRAFKEEPFHIGADNDGNHIINVEIY